jgi:hypothetical protein
VAIPHYYLAGAAFQKSLNRGVDLARQQLPHFGILWFCLVLPADSRDPLRVCDQENTLALRRERQDGEEK